MARTRIDLRVDCRDRSLVSDLALALAGLLGLIAALLASFAEPPALRRWQIGVPAVASLTRHIGDVQRRSAALLVWDRLATGDAIRSQDAIFVADNSEAILAFADGTALHLGESTLVIVDERRGPGAGGWDIDVEIKRGEVSGVAGSGSVRLRTGGTVARLDTGAEARVRVGSDKSARIDAIRQSTEVHIGDETLRLTERQARVVGADGASMEVAEESIALDTPGHGTRVYYTEHLPAVRFAWRGSAARGPYILELAEDREFERVVSTRRSRQQRADIVPPPEGTFHWRVRQEAGGKRVLHSDVWRFAVVRDLAPVPLRPRAGEVVYNPGGGEVVFSWSGLRTATQYRLRVARDRGMRDVLLDEVVDGTSYGDDRLSAGVYFWDIRVEDPDRTDPPVSQAIAFRLIDRPLPRPPKLFDPTLEFIEEPAPPPRDRGSWLWRLLLPVAHAQEKQTIPVQVLRWEKVPGIDRYLLQIAEDEGFARVLEERRVDAIYYRWRPPSDQKAYYFRVCSIDADGVMGKFSAPQRIGRVLGTLELIAPEDGAVFYFAPDAPAVALSWKPAQAASSYLVQTSRDPSFAGAAEPNRIKGEPRWVFRPEALGTFYWRVAAVDRAGQPTPYSTPRAVEVRLGAPRLRTPAAKAEIVYEPPEMRIELGWASGPAALFFVQVARDAKFEALLAELTSENPAAEFVAREAGEVHWRVRARDAEGRLTAWGPARSFHLRTPQIELVAPAPGARVETPSSQADIELRWTPRQGAARYVVQILPAGAEAGSPPRESTQASMRLEGLDLGAYRWMVRALDERGVVLDVSAPASFLVEQVVLLSAPVLDRPAQGERIALLAPGHPAVHLTWRGSQRAQRYEIQVGRSESFEPLLAGEQTTETDRAIRLEELGEYLWRARALGANDQRGPWSEVRRFVVAARVVGAELRTAREAESAHATVEVRLRDAEGVGVESVSLSARTSAGSIGEFESIGGGTYRAAWRAPAGERAERAEISIQGPFGLSLSGRIPGRSPAFSLGARAGVTSNLASAPWPRVELEVRYLLPWLRDRLFLVGTAGYLYATRRDALEVEVDSVLHCLPLTLAVGVRQPIDGFELYTAAGLIAAGYVGDVKVAGLDPKTDKGLHTGAVGSLGVGYELGPGSLFLDISYSYLRPTTGLVDVGGSGLTLTCGYRWSGP